MREQEDPYKTYEEYVRDCLRLGMDSQLAASTARLLHQAAADDIAATRARDRLRHAASKRSDRASRSADRKRHRGDAAPTPRAGPTSDASCAPDGPRPTAAPPRLYHCISDGTTVLLDA